MKMIKKREKVRGEGVGMCTKNVGYCEKEKVRGEVRVDVNGEVKLL